MNEPSKCANDAAAKIYSMQDWDLRVQAATEIIQQAIDAATADKDMGIERLTAEFETALKIIEDKDKRIEELEKELESGERLDLECLQRRVSCGFCGPLTDLLRRSYQMAALLDRVPHTDNCEDSCIACDWERMKQEKQ